MNNERRIRVKEIGLSCCTFKHLPSPSPFTNLSPFLPRSLTHPARSPPELKRERKWASGFKPWLDCLPCWGLFVSGGVRWPLRHHRESWSEGGGRERRGTKRKRDIEGNNNNTQKNNRNKWRWRRGCSWSHAYLTPPVSLFCCNRELFCLERVWLLTLGL